MSDELKRTALTYHAEPRPGKIEIALTKPSDTQADLILAYTPGVAAPVREIAVDPDAAYRYTAKANLVAVVTNGSAVLGLGKMGPLAAKPVMEGKAVLFKRFANVDVFDIEMEAPDPDSFVETLVRIAPTFGGINLEDIKAPECFEIEQNLIDRLDIPVFHDDQHGTAIITAAALLNALELQDKRLPEARVVCLGAGAAGIACMRMLVALGAHKDHLTLVDRGGVIHSGRSDINPYKREFALDTEARSLADAMEGADVFIGLSGPDLVSEAMIASMARRPVVFALSNPDPEIHPEVAQRVRPDLIMATGRSDFPNQVNNVLGFPFIFRGALDVRAERINEAMMVAATRALQRLAQEPVPRSVLQAYCLDELAFGPDYIVPKPFDPRLMDWVPPAVARAAVDTGVARSGYPEHYPH
jgi:malate dehydrogenase (oxaloacetate-decarboxylating)(NADP+)